MPIETYMGYRARCIAGLVESRASSLRRQARCIDLVVLSCEVATVALALLDLAIGVPLAAWTPLAIMLACVATTTKSHLRVPSQLAAARRQAEECHALHVYFESLSLVQRKARKCKLRCATTTEGAVLALVSSMTGVNPHLPGKQGGEHEEEE